MLLMQTMPVYCDALRLQPVMYMDHYVLSMVDLNRWTRETAISNCYKPWVLVVPISLYEEIGVYSSS